MTRPRWDLVLLRGPKPKWPWRGASNFLYVVVSIFRWIAIEWIFQCHAMECDLYVVHPLQNPKFLVVKTNLWDYNQRDDEFHVAYGWIDIFKLTMFNTPSTKRRWGRGGFKSWPIYYLPLWMEFLPYQPTLSVSSEPCTQLTRAVRRNFFVPHIPQAYLSNPWAVKF